MLRRSIGEVKKQILDGEAREAMSKLMKVDDWLD